MKRKSYLFVIAALLCGAWFWAFWGNGPKDGKASFVVRGDAGKETVAVSAGKDTVPANSGNDPERFVYDGEHFGSKQAMEQAKKQDYIDLRGADAKITLHVTDSNGRNVPDATVKVDFGVFEKSTSTTGKTDGSGIFVWSGRTDGEVVYTVEKDGYYKTRTAYRLNLINGDDVKDGKWIPWGRTIEVTLKEKRNPIPMYAKNAGIRLPKRGEPFGFDFKVGDLVKPYGTGEQTDLYFLVTVERRNETFGDFKKELFITAVQQGEGLLVNTIDKWSQLLSAHEAQENGYESQFYSVMDRTPSTVLQQIEMSDEEYLTVRTRIVKDDEGNIISANYGKIMSKLGYYRDEKNPDGAVVKFLYYFNPTPNDRNLEFDTSKNLFGNDSQNRVSIP